MRRACWSMTFWVAAMGLAACESGGDGPKGVLPNQDVGVLWEISDGTGDEGAPDAPDASDDGQTDVAVDVASDETSSPDPTPDPGPADTGPPDTGPDVPVDPTKWGGGVLLSEVDSAYINAAVAEARFTDPQADPAPEQSFGACGVSFVDPNATAAQAFGYDAGAITTASTTPPVTLTPTSQGSNGTGYTSNLPSDQEDLLPGGGALMSISAAGGADIPGFTIVVQAPEPVTLTGPAVGFGVEHPRSQPMTVSWNKGIGSQVVVTLSPLSGDLVPEPKAGQTAVCIVDGDPGTLTIPSAALQALSTGNHAISVTRLKTGTAEAGGKTASATVTRSTGDLLSLQ